ncbi:MAG: Sapep family Mn(2+)-dependent dipeptidase [Clostridia bacterium]|nr:Sapep family Mn(2+)-dependent dipeptidase [Clostridia bacterium]
MNRVNEWIDAHKDELVEATARLVRVPSVGAPAVEGHPFGDGVAAAMDEALAIASEWGFATHNHEYYAVTAQCGEGDPRLGVLCHLDVVPEGVGWVHPPYGAVVEDGRLFGRGAIDDKGPTAATLFALRAIKECGIPLSAPCRVVMGGDEETGSTDMEYYATKEAFPPYVFSPDGHYPLINTEKGRVQLAVTAPCEDDRLIAAYGGEALNAVPTDAWALVKGVADIPATVAGHKVEVTAEGDALRLATHGVAAHGSMPEKGENAVTALLEVLAALEIGGEAVKAAARCFPFAETGGDSAGAACRDEQSGPLTLSLNRLRLEKGRLLAMADIRFPVTETVASVQEKLHRGLDAHFTVSFENCVEGHHVPADSPFVQALLRVYEEQTGQPGRCLAIGGGTYVHEIPGGVAFGAEFPGTDNCMHGADEFIGVDELVLNAKLIAHAILAVCGDNW